jgi:excisionase family DNA binding protein
MSEVKTELISITPEQLQGLIKEAVQTELAKQQPSENEAENDKLLSQKEAASYLKVTEVTLHHWKKAGKVKFKRIGHRILFRKGDLIDAMNKG